MKKRKKVFKESLVLYASLFMMASCGISYEYTFSKISSDLLGNSAKQWAIIIGLMMFFMGVGSDLQKHIKDKHLLDKFIVFEIILGIIGGFGSILMLSVFGSFHDHFILVQYLLIILVGLLIGLEIPLLTRINEKYTTELKFNLGSVLQMDYIGSFAGALLWIFFLPRFFTLVEISFVLGLINIVVAMATLLYFRKSIVHFSKIMLLVCVTLGGISYGFFHAKDWTIAGEQKLFKDQVIYAATTKYQHIVLTKSFANDIYCYINGNLQFCSIDEHIYHEMLVHPALQIAPSRKNILILGGGDGLALREILTYDDVETVTLVDLDPRMTELARTNEYMAALNGGSLDNSKVKVIANNALIDKETETVHLPEFALKNKIAAEDLPEVNIVNIDAYKFVEQVSGLYDVIIIDFPDPNNLELSKLYSKGFYTRVVSKLSKYGIMVQQSTSPVHARETYLCIGRTMDSAGLSVIPYHENVPSFGEWGWWIGGRSEAFGTYDIKHKLSTLKVFPERVQYITPDIVRSSLVFGKQGLETNFSTINTITSDAVFGFYEKAWRMSQ